MKILPLVTCFCLLSFWGTAGNGVIPQVVKDAFAQLYPDVDGVDVFWETDKEAVMATFKQHGQLSRAFFDKAGQWRETRIRLYYDQLPRLIRSFLEKQPHDADITFIGKVLRPDGSYIFRIESEFYEEVVIKLIDRQGLLLEEKRIPFTEGLEIY
ncbi:MAG: PepSY-like domain-containing protein [Phaeodactylibacter sp.]|nr:PepSY-like domain-containing protein [Phaeodactylibacter sp.]MCB9273435.1 PepSY-like domain-containing protein [Lewinellaceae bacterium]